MLGDIAEICAELAENLEIARARDATRSVAYYRGDAYALPFADGSFDAARR